MAKSKKVKKTAVSRTSAKATKKSAKSKKKPVKTGRAAPSAAHEKLLKDLKNPKASLKYLNDALLNKDQKVFFLALKDTIESEEHNITALAKKTHISRQNLYHMLSKKGNPRYANLASLLKVLGLQVQLVSKSKK